MLREPSPVPPPCVRARRGDTRLLLHPASVSGKSSTFLVDGITDDTPAVSNAATEKGRHHR